MTSSSPINGLVRYADAHTIPFDDLGWPGKRYRLQEQAGEPVDFQLKRWRFDGTVVDEELIRHEVHDGVGALTGILESRGWTVPTMPALKEKQAQRPSRLRQLLLFWRYIQRVRGWPSRFRIEPKWDVKNTWPAAVVAIFDRNRTDAYTKALKAQGASSTSGILSSLDRHCAERLLEQGSPRRWMVPVNMRTSPSKAGQYGNTVTSILLPFPEAQSPSQVHAAMREMLAANFQWGTMLFADIAKRFREDRVRRMAERFDPRRTIFGFVTNVGPWPQPDSTPPATDTDAVDVDTAWGVVPPVGRRGPLACTMLTWRGRLVVVLKIHGCLGMSKDDVRAILESVAADVAAVAGGAGKASVFTDDATAR